MENTWALQSPKLQSPAILISFSVEDSCLEFSESKRPALAKTRLQPLRVLMRCATPDAAVEMAARLTQLLPGPLTPSHPGLPAEPSPGLSFQGDILSLMRSPSASCCNSNPRRLGAFGALSSTSSKCGSETPSVEAGRMQVSSKGRNTSSLAK